MSTHYEVKPFLGNTTSGSSVQAVADQLESVLNGSTSSNSVSFLILAPVSIQIQPGCISRILGGSPSWTIFDQVVMGPAPRLPTMLREISAVESARSQQEQSASTTPRMEGSQPREPDSRQSSIRGPLSDPSALMRTWANMSRKKRIASLGAAGVILLWWLGSSDSRPKPVAIPTVQQNRPEAIAPTPQQTPQQTAQKSEPSQVPLAQEQVSQALVPRPLLRVGDRWVSEVTDHQDARLNYRSERTVIEAGRDTVLTSVRTLKSNYTRTVEYDIDWALRSSRLPNGAATFFRPALPYMQFPAAPGKAWSESVVETSSTGEEKVHQIQASIIRWETVTVPAGTFWALRVELSDRISINGATVHSGTDISWYVPQVKRSVKSEETSLDPASGERRRRTIVLTEYMVQ